jgi:hypothetical protein
MIALAAAYAVALHTVLPVLAGFSPAIGGGAGTPLLCSVANTASTDQGLPGKPQPLCPGCPACAMPACAGAALRVADAVTLVPVALTALPPALRPAGRPPARLELGADHRARGPPVA